MPSEPSSSPPRPESARWYVDAGLAVVVGALAYALSCFVIGPGDEAKGFGVDWLSLSRDPALLQCRFPHRMLAPVLAWSLGLGGANYLLFVRGLAVLLLATVFFFGRRRGLAVVDAALVAVAIALTAPIQLYKDHWVGYPDPICYSLFLANLLVAKRPVLFWGVWFVNLTNHELAAFLLPWLWFVRREAGGRVLHDVVGAGAGLAVYAAYYFAIKAKAQQLFSYEYFANHPLFPGGTVVVLALALVHLVVAWGPVLAVLAWHQHTRAHGRERLHLWLVALGIGVIFCIAFDWARHSNLILVPFVLASVRFLQSGHRIAYGVLVAVGAGLMLWIPPWAPSAWPTDAMANINLLVETGMVNPLPPRFEGDLNVHFGSVSTALGVWVPRVAALLGPIVAMAVAIWGVGFWLARRDRAATSGRAA
ncbi:MAG: hypothetical protein JNK15_17300 [Planctomycetes bacterium]|nr:hypothetical protein [Planctomycetota bacterium]